MGTSGFILKNRLEYSVEAMMGSIMIAVFKADITISFGGRIFNNDDGSFCYSTMNISSNFNPYDKENQEEFIFYVEAIKERYINDEAFDWVSNGQNLYQVSYIEKISKSERIAFKFIYEYLKLNPNDYFWAEGDWAFDLQDMEKINKLHFDPSWYCKDPKLIAE